MSCVDPERKSFCGVYMSCVDPKRKSFKVTESMCHEWLTKQEVLKFRCLYNICGFPAERKSFKVTEPVYVSCVAHQTRRIEVSVSVCHVWIPKESFKVTESMYHVWHTKTLKLLVWWATWKTFSFGIHTVSYKRYIDSVTLKLFVWCAAHNTETRPDPEMLNRHRSFKTSCLVTHTWYGDSVTLQLFLSGSTHDM